MLQFACDRSCQRSATFEVLRAICKHKHKHTQVNVGMRMYGVHVLYMYCTCIVRKLTDPVLNTEVVKSGGVLLRVSIEMATFSTVFH